MLLQTNEQAVAQGDNIVADGWAGAFIPPPSTLTPYHVSTLVFKMRVFMLLNLSVTDPLMNGQTDGRTKPLIETPGGL